MKPAEKAEYQFAYIESAKQYRKMLYFSLRSISLQTSRPKRVIKNSRKKRRLFQSSLWYTDIRYKRTLFCFVPAVGYAFDLRKKRVGDFYFLRPHIVEND